MPLPPPIEVYTQASALLTSLDATARELADIGQRLKQQADALQGHNHALWKFLALHSALIGALEMQKPNSPPDPSGSNDERPATVVDGRSVLNPEKNLKISAQRTFRWAFEQGKSAQEAMERAYEVVSDRARTLYNMKKVPNDVTLLIQELYISFGKR